MPALTKITPQQMDDYVNHRITSTQLAELTGYAAPYIRRSIQREKKPPSPNTKWRKERSDLIKARRAFHDSISHLSLKQIKEQASVSESTASRIKCRNKDKQNGPQ